MPKIARTAKAKLKDLAHPERQSSMLRKEFIKTAQVITDQWSKLGTRNIKKLKAELKQFSSGSNGFMANIKVVDVGGVPLTSQRGLNLPVTTR